MDNLKEQEVLCSKKRQKQKLHITPNKKKEYEKKALNIVVELIDGGLQEDDLFNKLRSINVCHYEDVVEERFILKKCGYTMCSKQLTSIPTQQFKISLVRNKVYDITERKKFCSSKCYKSSKYLQSQLLTSPLWLHDIEVIPKFKLLKIEMKRSSEYNIHPKVKDSGKELNAIFSDEELQGQISKLTI